MDNNPTIPKLSDLLNLHADAAARNLFCSMPGRIETYDAAKTTATVSVMMKSVNEQTGATADYAGLIDIPVLQLTGGASGPSGGCTSPMLDATPVDLLLWDG